MGNQKSESETIDHPRIMKKITEHSLNPCIESGPSNAIDNSVKNASPA